ncbi:ABC transporter [Brachybacterium phenoliresistens]|uniref:ABC transporter n=1 Tax=Brachybacterium phenoliresistens TaxID=396014 RepID=Z9JW00_9MICO|nr:AarF/UbiB family protein [Brachybacterium phenoliresistens]EWS82384.1 ABC transporter [Brachybacterium phenoliresistens]
MVVERGERYRQIAEVLVGFGWSAVADALGIGRQVPSFAAIVRRHRHEHGRGASAPQPGGEAPSAPVRLRLALEALGPTFIKLGQMLATREDILPPAYARELGALQDGAAAVPFSDIRAVLRAELGADAEHLFAHLEQTPLASASIGQAHAARLADGREVVVKVRKPGVSSQVEADLAILRDLTEIAAREWELAERYGLPALVASFDRAMRRELDYRIEAESARAFARNLADDPLVRIPAVIDELSTARVLTEERATGMRIDDTAALDAAGLDRRALAQGATRTVIRMVLADGLFHADPHPGNMFVQPDGRLWLIDFGMVGELDEDTRGELLWLLLALGRHDADAVMSRLLHLAPPRGTVDRRRLRADVRSLMETVSGNLAEMSMVDFFAQLTGMLRRHALQLPGEVATLLRMLVLTESTATVLDPGFRLGAVLEEVGYGALFEQWGVHALSRRLTGAGLRSAHLAADLPERGELLLEDFEAHGLRVRLDAQDLEPLVERVEVVSDRVIAGITMSGLLVALGSVVATGAGPAGRWRDPIMLAAGGATSLLGAYLMAGAGPARGARRAVRRALRRP